MQIQAGEGEMAENREGIVKRVFQAAIERAPEDRAAFVASACGDDERARDRVMDLLGAHDLDDGFLASQEKAAASGGAESDEIGAAELEGTTIGPYKVLQLIGEGGFGAVYMAEQEQPIRRRVALKLIKLGMDTKQVIARFEAERQALAMMEHPNIARVLDAGATETGRPYFVMELVRGVSITEYCDENRLSTRERLELFSEVCAAVQHAHQKGVIHRDIKPSNVLVTLHDGRPVPKVIDFGVARATHQRLTERTLFTEFGQFIGTPAYMSPEQASMSGLDIDTRSDIYSLGVLLYELLTGTTPYTNGQLRYVAHVEILRVLAEVDPPRPSTRLSQLGDTAATVAKLRGSEPGALERLLRGDLDWIVMKALEKDRMRRYASASELSADIHRYFGGDPVSAGPPGVGYRLRKLVRKNRGKFGAAAAVIMALVFGGMTATWQGVEMQRQGQRARANGILAYAATTEDPLLKALLIDEIADEPDMPGKLAVLRDAANHPLPISVLQVSDYANDMHYSPDGERLVSSFRDGTVRVWRADGAGEPLIFPHDVEVDEARFGPQGDRILTGSTDGIVRVWPLDGGDPMAFKADLRIQGASFSPDGSLIIASTAEGGPVWIWPADGTREPVVLDVEGEGLTTSGFFPDGERILTGGTNGLARIWRADGTGPIATFSGDPGQEWVYTRMSPDGRRVVVRGEESVRVYATDGSEAPLVLEHRGSVLWTGDFNGELVTTASRDGTVRIWHLDRPDEPIILRHPVDHIERTVEGTPSTMPGYLPVGPRARISNDGSRVFTRSADGTIRVWSTDGIGPEATFTGPGLGMIRNSPDGSTLTANFSDGSVRTWSLGGAGAEAVILHHDDFVNEVVFSPDGGKVATASRDGIVRVWSGDGSVGPIEFRGHTASVGNVRFSRDGLRLVSASDDGTARVWTVDGSERPVVLNHGGRVADAAFSPEGDRMVTGGFDDGRVVLWSSDGTGNSALVAQHRERVRSVSFSPDGSRVLSASFDQWAQITPLDGTADPVRLRGNYEIYDAEFSADGRWIVIGSQEGDVRVIPAAGGPARVLRGEATRVRTVAFSPDGDRVLAGADDGTVRIWRLDGGDEPIELSGHIGPVTGAAFSPDGRRVATASIDGTVRIWRVTWPDLLEYVRSNLRACLTAGQRMHYLAESQRAAAEASAACERRLRETRR
jgi:WD40 repeat protein/serine/threonine protein kinase